MDKRLEQVDRIVSSPVLQSSESLCNLLRYLVRHSLETPEAPLKEHQIAMEVFGRPASFDPRLDSTVRVQMSRLRAKLTEYYSTLGKDDPMVVEVPKGSHAVAFREREISAPEPSITLAPPPARRSPWWKLAAAAVLVVAVMLAAWKILAPGRPPGPARPVSSLALFWNGILRGTESPLVVFSNAEFVGRPETGLRYFRSGRDAADSVFDHYTGVGEVISIHDLDQLFNRLGKSFVLKRGRLMNWDDTKGRDVIFLGSPSENLSLRELPMGRDFKFQSLDHEPRKGDLGIVNLHPAPGEDPVYLASPDLPITEDFALAELVTGAASSQSILLLAGTTTFGTQGAVEFVCNEDRVRDLLSRIRGANGGISDFSAVLRVKISRGVPIESSIAALRRSATR